MVEKLVSAIITTHNRAPNIVSRAVNSVMKQTYKNIEVIVVDDSSTDYNMRGSVEKSVREISSKIIYIQHNACLGACVARNTGLAHANGEFIAFLDDDDEWLPEKIEEQLKGFNNDHIALVYSGIKIINETSNRIQFRPKRFRSGDVFRYLLAANFIGTTSNPIIRSKCLENIGYFDTDMASSQDHDLWLRISERYHVNCVEKTLLNYYIYDDDRISTDVDRKLSGLERINNKFSDQIRKNPEAWYKRHMSLVPWFVRKGRRDQAFSLWRKCVYKRPIHFLINTQSLCLIITGYNTFVYKIFRKLKLFRTI